MPSLEIIKPGLMTSIQDLGRKGLAYYAFSASGALDKNAARIALLLHNLDEHAPIIECASIAPHIKFNGNAKICLTGANFNWKINEKPIQINQVININKGDLLQGGVAKNKVRGYLAIDQVLRIEKYYDSYATDTNLKQGGYEGRLLKKGDIIEWINTPKKDTQDTIQIYRGPEYDWLSDESKQLLTTKLFTISSDSNRMGSRLTGPILKSRKTQLDYSSPILPGFIQLTPSGQLIVLLNDGQVTGGYPRIAYLDEREIYKFVQIKIGAKVIFNES